MNPPLSSDLPTREALKLTAHAIQRLTERSPKPVSWIRARVWLTMWLNSGEIVSIACAIERGVRIGGETQASAVLLAGSARLGWFALPVTVDGFVLTTLTWKAPRSRPRANPKRFHTNQPELWDLEKPARYGRRAKR